MNENKPELLDMAISYIQEGLKKNLPWLDEAFGRAERIVKQINGKKVYLPVCYKSMNDYMELIPDSGIGNFCFFYVDDPQEVDWQKNVSIGIQATFSLIVWLDYRKVFNSTNIRNKEEVKKQILDVLNKDVWMRRGRFNIERIFEKAENIYDGFSLNEVDNQFLMHPYGGFRFEGQLNIQETCVL